MAAAVSQSVPPEELAEDRHDLADISLLATALARWLAVGTLLAAAAIVVGRRLAGGLSSPPSIMALIAVAAAGACLVFLVERLGRTPFLAGGQLRLVGWLARGCLLATLAAVGLFWTHALPAVATAVLMLGTTVGLSARIGWRPHLPRWRLPAQRATAPASAAVPAAASAPSRPPALAGQLVQWQERYLLADGREQLRGQLVVTLAAESRLATGHIGFCPALPAIPDVTVATDYDALEVVVDAAEVLPWGIRVECRVEDPADELVAIPIDIDVRLPATAPLASTAPSPPSWTG